MKKEILVALLAIGFIFAGVMSASAGAVTWTLVETASMAYHSPGADGLLGTADDGLSERCNMDPVANCAFAGGPTKGSYSYAKLTFQMASSCGAGNMGQSCTQNTDCGSAITPCVPCQPNPGLTYFGLNASGGSKGTGTYRALACENQFDITALNIGTSEVVSFVGGSCMTLQNFNSSTGCADGLGSTSYDLRLWTSLVPACNYNAGVMPGLNLAGRIYAVPTYPAGVCTYTTTEISNIASTVGLGSGDYLSIMCGSGTLPTGLQAVCIPGAPWQAVIVASTSSYLPSECPSTCGNGCTAAAAEGVE